MAQTLFDYQPSLDDIPRRTSWNALMAAGVRRLATLDSRAGLDVAQALSTSLLECFLSDKRQMANDATGCLQTVVGDCLGTDSPDAQKAIRTAAAGKSNGVTRLVDTLAQGLRYRYQPRYAEVLRVLETLVRALGAAACPLCNAIVAQLVEVSTPPPHTHTQFHPLSRLWFFLLPPFFLDPLIPLLPSLARAFKPRERLAILPIGKWTSLHWLTPHTVPNSCTRRPLLPTSRTLSKYSAR